MGLSTLDDDLGMFLPGSSSEPHRVSNVHIAKRLDVGAEGANRSKDELAYEEDCNSQCPMNRHGVTAPYLTSPTKGKDIMRKVHSLLALGLTLLSAGAFAGCIGYSGPGGPCYTGPGGGLYTGPGGGAYTGPGGGASTAPGGGAYTGPGGGASTAPGGGLYTGPGGGAYTGPGGGAYTGPGGGASTAPGGGCYTGPSGVATDKWNRPSPYCK